MRAPAEAQSRGFYPDKYAFKINLRVSEIM